MNQNNIVDIIDVEQRHYKIIKEILAKFLPYKKVLAYGSRVKWNASETSDLDLVVFNATQKEIYEAKEEFDESNIPFIIQILNWETIPQDFKENIEQKYHILQDKSDWGIFKLGDTIEKNQYSILNNLRKPLSSNIRSKMKDGELYPYYGAAGIIDYINDFKLNGFYLLIAEDGTVTSNGINPMLTLAMGKFWVSNHAHIISSDEDWKIKFLYYLLSSVDINEYITGAVQPKLNKANLLSIKIYLHPYQNKKQLLKFYLLWMIKLIFFIAKIKRWKAWLKLFFAITLLIMLKMIGRKNSLMKLQSFKMDIHLKVLILKMSCQMVTKF